MNLDKYKTIRKKKLKKKKRPAWEKQFEDMSDEQMTEFNQGLINESNKVLDPRIDPKTAHPSLVVRIVANTKRTISKDDLCEFLYKCGGNVTHAAELLHVSRGTVIKWLTKDGTIKILDEINESWNDITESLLNKKIIMDENLDAIKFRLKTKAKNRGYYEKVEQDINQTIVVKIEAEPPPDTIDQIISDDEVDAEHEAKRVIDK